VWYKNIAGRFFALVTRHACDGQTDGVRTDRQTDGQNYDSQDRASIARAVKNRVTKKTKKRTCCRRREQDSLVYSIGRCIAGEVDQSRLSIVLPPCRRQWSSQRSTASDVQCRSLDRCTWLPSDNIITFRVSRRRREMYCGHARLCMCVCLCVCLSVRGRMPTVLHGP